MKKIPSKMNFKIKNISSGIPAEYATFLKTVKDRILRLLNLGLRLRLIAR